MYARELSFSAQIDSACRQIRTLPRCSSCPWGTPPSLPLRIPRSRMTPRDTPSPCLAEGSTSPWHRKSTETCWPGTPTCTQQPLRNKYHCYRSKMPQEFSDAEIRVSAKIVAYLGQERMPSSWRRDSDGPRSMRTPSFSSTREPAVPLSAMALTTITVRALALAVQIRPGF